LITRRKISVNGHVTTDARRRVQAGDEMIFDPEARRPRREEDLDPSSVVHLDAQVVVVAKPPGIQTVPFDEDDEELALCHQVQRYLAHRGGPRPKQRRSALPRLMVVHRLDRWTSGLMLFARSYSASQRLGEQFREHTVVRSYLALVHGRAHDGTIRSHLLEDRGDGIRGSTEFSPDPKIRGTRRGKEAITHVKVEEILADERASLVSCRLETGRTNQIRIHLSEMGNPLVGETIYLRDYRRAPIEAPRQMLHAAELGFVHPVTGEALHFEQPLPSDMKRLLEALRQGGEPNGQ
jgi:23S rRNA pseudouridine1911/1915/1917 synthase